MDRRATRASYAAGLSVVVALAVACDDPEPKAVDTTTDAGHDIAFRGVPGDSSSSGNNDVLVDVGPNGPGDVFATDTESATTDASADSGGPIADSQVPGDSSSKGNNDVFGDIATEWDATTAPDVYKLTNTKLIFNNHEVTVQLGATLNGLRTYHLHSTAKLLDGPKDGKRTVKERPGWPRLRSCNRVMDALYALAIEEVIENSVDAVQEGGFNGGKPVACKCFQTGAKWTWAWTRDTAYAIDLALALLDPVRSRNTVLFKTSKPKAGVKGGVQVVQDTGTGGAWPVSTDRVSWALGAMAVRNALTGNARKEFESAIAPVLANTVARNAEVAFDPVRKRYRGESSFLDWREQSYPQWTADKPADIAMSESRSTNALHAMAIDAMVALGAKPSAATHPMPGAFKAAYTTTYFDRALVGQSDLLARSFDARRAGAKAAFALLKDYPYAAGGPPVIAPQLRHAPIYHNRGMWPFVTAYALSAAQQSEWVGEVTWRLIGTSALQLSNMENFEAASGEPFVNDGKLSGPVVNSRRQLWSVAGFLHVVHRLVFGIRQAPDHIHYGRDAKLPAKLVELFGAGTTVELADLEVWGVKTTFRAHLPDKTPPPGSWLSVPAGDIKHTTLPRATFSAGGPPKTLDIWLQPLKAPGGGGWPTDVKPTAKEANWFAPSEPTNVKVAPSGKGGAHLEISWTQVAQSGVSYSVFRNGEKTQTVHGSKPNVKWTNVNAGTDSADAAMCYSVAARDAKTGHESPHSAPVCYWGEGGWRVQELTAYRIGGVPIDAKGSTWEASWSAAHGKSHWANWGRWINAKTPERAVVHSVVPRATGKHVLQLIYANTSGPVSTGIACANKRVRIFDAADVDLAVPDPWSIAKPLAANGTGQGFAAMPQLGTSHRWGESTVVELGKLQAGKPYHIVIDEDGGVMNMTYLEHFTIYSGKGGGKQPYNRVDLAAVRLLAMSGTKTKASAPNLAFNGKNDIDKFGKSAWHTPGVTQASWEHAAFGANASHVQGAVVSKAFEADTAGLFVYLGAIGLSGKPTAKPSTGMTYLGQTSKLPFTASWAIGLRSKSDLGDGFGPWAALYRRLGTGTWVLQRRLRVGHEIWTSKDKHTLSFTLPRAELAGVGTSSKWRVCAHVVTGKPGHEYKDVLPPTHAPWKSQSTGFYEVDFNALGAAKNWPTK